MGFFLLVVAVVMIFLAVKSVKSAKGNQKRLAEYDPDYVVKGSMAATYVAFKGDKFIANSVDDGNTEMDISKNVFVGTDKVLVLPSVNGVILGLNRNQIVAACDYAAKNGSKTSLYSFMIPNSPQLEQKLHLSGKQLTMCAMENDNFFFANDPNFNEYRLIDVDYNPRFNTISNTNTKGRAGSALVGGLLAGPVGAVVGGSRKRHSNTTSKEVEESSPAVLTFVNKDNREFKTTIQLTETNAAELKTNFLRSRI